MCSPRLLAPETSTRPRSDEDVFAVTLKGGGARFYAIASRTQRTANLARGSRHSGVSS
jgi:hypothetical protein